MKSMQKGFTLIELMIVVAIIAILAAIAIPAYQNYLIRTQVSEGAVLTGGVKTAESEFYSNKGYFPKSNESAGVSAASSISGKYVTKVEVSTDGKGLITATFGGQANTAITASGKDTLVLSPITSAGSISWTCTQSKVEQKYLPSSCRD
jgi:type IV pilus assembly protein PilA